MLWVLGRADVFIWSATKLVNLGPRLRVLFGDTCNYFKGWAGQSLCDIADFKLGDRKPMFFKSLYNLLEYRYTDNTTLLIDDSWYKCEQNRPGMFIILPPIGKRRGDYLTECLMTWMEGWFQAEDRLEYAKQFQNAPQTQEDVFVKDKLATGGKIMSYEEWVCKYV